VPNKKLPAKKFLPANFFAGGSLPGATSGKGFAECKVAFAGSIRLPAKRPNPVVTCVHVFRGERECMYVSVLC